LSSVSREPTEDGAVGEAFGCAALNELSKVNMLIIWSAGLFELVEVGLYVNSGPFGCAVLTELSKVNMLSIWSTGLFEPIDVGLDVESEPEVVVALADEGVEGDDVMIALVVVELANVELSMSSPSSPFSDPSISGFPFSESSFSGSVLQSYSSIAPMPAGLSVQSGKGSPAIL
jgi:hypothetical protein